MYGRFDRASRNRGAVFLSTFLFAPPELHETGIVLKHWNRATEYVKTGYVHDLVSEIYALVCRLKKLQIYGYHVVKTMSSNQEYDCKTRFSPSQSPEIRCALCHEHLKDAHSHPGRWNSELQQFLLQYTTVPLSSCVCKADEVSIRRGLGGKQKGFIPRWVK